MKILLDTHIAIWSIMDTKRLPQSLIDDIENYDNEVFVSMVSVWEVALKSAKSSEKIPIDEKKFLEYITKMDFNILPIKTRHIMNLRQLSVYDDNIIHKDPFDRMLVAQTDVEDMLLYTKDEKMANYKVNNINLII